MGAALYLVYAGNIGGKLVKDYCNNNFERWTRLKYGQFPVALDNTYAELEKTHLCSPKCPCTKIMFQELWIGPYWDAQKVSTQKIINDTVVRNNLIQEYNRKVFNGTAQNVFACD